MKKSINKLTAYLGMLLLATFIIHGCSDVSSPYSEDVLYAGFDDAFKAETCTDGETLTLKTKKKGKTIGDISYSVDADNIYVIVTPIEGWGITEIDLYVSQSSYTDNLVENEDYDSAQVDPLEFAIPLSEVGLSSGDDLSQLFIAVYAEVGEISGGSYWGGGGSWWGKSSKSKKGKYGKYDNDDRGKKGKYGKYGKDDDDDHKWGKKGKYGKDDDDDHKWGKKGKYDKDDDDHKGGKKKYYCNKTEKATAKAKIHVENFDECEPGSGGIGGTGGGNR